MILPPSACQREREMHACECLCLSARIVLSTCIEMQASEHMHRNACIAAHMLGPSPSSYSRPARPPRQEARAQSPDSQRCECIVDQCCDVRMRCMRARPCVGARTSKRMHRDRHHRHGLLVHWGRQGSRRVCKLLPAEGVNTYGSALWPRGQQHASEAHPAQRMHPSIFIAAHRGASVGDHALEHIQLSTCFGGHASNPLHPSACTGIAITRMTCSSTRAGRAAGSGAGSCPPST